MVIPPQVITAIGSVLASKLAGGGKDEDDGKEGRRIEALIRAVREGHAQPPTPATKVNQPPRTLGG